MLIYTTDQSPGIVRKGAGKGFYYIHPTGKKVRENATLRRIDALAIPPAYSEVWICPLENGHLQATGRDQAKRKQYRYHPDWQEIRNLDKFDKLQEVGAGLPRLRRKLRKDLKNFDGTKEEVIAVAVRIIDKLGLRVGNERYLEGNKTRGISTLANENIDFVKNGHIRIDYTAKGGKHIQVELSDPLITQSIADCHELGGQRLFTYEDKTGQLHTISSSDINHYLSQTYDTQISAKDLRTWRASVEAIDYLRKIKRPADRDAEVRDAIRYAADQIKNRYATCRKHYVHPKILTAYQAAGTTGFSRLKIKPQSELQLPEVLLLRILQS